MNYLIVLFSSLGILCGSAVGKEEIRNLPPITKVISFEDSLTDAGTFGFRFTTNPGLTWAQHIAEHYGQEPSSNQHVLSYDQVYKGISGLDGPGGLNYAEGGARVNRAYSSVSQDPEGTPISANIQLLHFLKQHKTFRPDQLVTLYIGTNDVACHYDLGNSPLFAKRLRDNIIPSQQEMDQERIRIIIAANDTAHLAEKILRNGAERLVVLKLVDMGGLPWFRSEAARVFMSELSNLYNEELTRKLPKNPRLLLIDTPGFIQDLVDNSKKLGFDHGIHEDARMEADSDYCDTRTLKDADADQTYIFAASVHMTTKTNLLLAKYIIEKIEDSNLK